jgi:hypothetical protein
VDYTLQPNVEYAIWKPSAPANASEFGSVILDTAAKKARVTIVVGEGDPIVILYDPNEWQYHLKERGFLIPPMVWSQGILVYTQTPTGVTELVHIVPQPDDGGIMNFTKGVYRGQTQRGTYCKLAMTKVLSHIVCPGVRLLLDATKLPEVNDRVPGKCVCFA